MHTQISLWIVIDCYCYSHLRVFTQFCDDLGHAVSRRSDNDVSLFCLSCHHGPVLRYYTKSYLQYKALSSFVWLPTPPPPGGIIRMSFSLRYAGVSGSLGWSQHVNFRSLLLYFCVWLCCLTWVAPFTPLCGLSSLLLFFCFCVSPI